MPLLPFLKKKETNSGGGTMIIERKPDGEPSQSDDALEACAQDIIRAISSKDYKHLAQALRAVFQVLESEPHDEYSIGNEGME